MTIFRFGLVCLKIMYLENCYAREFRQCKLILISVTHIIIEVQILTLSFELEVSIF